MTAKIYIAGKVSKNSIFGTHHWRDEFCTKLQELSGVTLKNLDPTKISGDQGDYKKVFAGCCQMIAEADVMVVYLSDDISIGGSQEILIAQYLNKPVIGLAPHGGKFNGSTKEYFGQVVRNYKDPFVFSTCDVVAETVEDVAEALKRYKQIHPRGITLISEALASTSD